jgi:aerobic carbon-monoxide dehydrogenase large subunit
MATATPTAMIGAPIKRREDPRLITGHASYTDDITPAGTMYLHMVRSPYAHAKITNLNVEAAKGVPGVVAVITGEELKKAAGPLAAVSVGGHPIPDHYSIAVDRVRFVGEIVAAVVAESRGAARDAGDLVEVDYEELPVLVDMEEAYKSSNLIHDGIEKNLAAELHFGNDVTEAFANPEVLVEARFVNQRLAPNPLENRAVLAQYRPGEDTFTLTTSTQIPHILRTLLAGVLNHPEHQIRVIAPEVGGGFGCKVDIYAEEVITCYASRLLRRPVKWTETRSEAMMATIHGRDNIDYIRIAATPEGKIVGLDITAYCNMGAYLQLLTTSVPVLCGVIVTGAYDIPNAHFKALCLYTNTTPTDAYRGAGRPEATYMLERIVTMLAEKLGKDPMEIRRLNFIKKEQFPYTTPLGLTYDTGDYQMAMDKALGLFDYAGWRTKQEEARQQGRYIGIGQSTYVEVCGLGPGQGMTTQRGYESAVVRAEVTGKVTVFTGTSPHGQGTETVFAQVIADEFGIPVEDVVIKHGDTDMSPYGMGTYGSRGVAVGGGALKLAAQGVTEKAKKIAAFQLEANAEDIEFEAGKFSVKGAPSRSITWQEVCFKAYIDPKMAPVIEPGLESTRYFEPGNFVFPFGTHLCAVEVMPDTGEIKIMRYLAVDDCGTQLNPMLVHGQLHGGLTQGIAQALYEEVVYDANGQLISGTLMDYTLPTAGELPHYDLDHTVTTTPVNPLGAKGIGEAGTIASTPCIVNAVIDALKPLGIADIQMPLRPEKVWKAMHAAQSSNGQA